MSAIFGLLAYRSVFCKSNVDGGICSHPKEIKDAKEIDIDKTKFETGQKLSGGETMETHSQGRGVTYKFQ